MKTQFLSSKLDVPHHNRLKIKLKIHLSILRGGKYKMRPCSFPPSWIYDSALTKWELFSLNTTGTLKPSEVSYCRHKASRLHTPPFCTFSPCVIDVCFYKIYRVLFVSWWTDGLSLSKNSAVGGMAWPVVISWTKIKLDLKL